jgi:hypothetical protein
VDEAYTSVSRLDKTQVFLRELRSQAIPTWPTMHGGTPYSFKVQISDGRDPACQIRLLPCSRKHALREEIRRATHPDYKVDASLATPSTRWSLRRRRWP